MFTGIVTDIGEIVDASSRSRRGSCIGCGSAAATTGDASPIGASIACNGICLTVVGSGADGGRTWYEVDAGAETLAMTTREAGAPARGSISSAR